MRIPISVACVLLVAACSKDEAKPDEKKAEAKPEATDKAVEKKPAPEPAPSAGAAEVFHALDRNAAQGFEHDQLAVGGGFVYWVNRPRIDQNGLRKDTIERKPAAGGAVETVVPAGKVFGIAADAQNLYWSDHTSIWARQHAGGEPVELAKAGPAFSIAVGDKDLMVRDTRHIAIVSKTPGPVETVWEGKQGRHRIAADGDRFLVGVDRELHEYRRGAKPVPLGGGSDDLGDIATDGGRVYVSWGGITKALWRVPTDAAQPLERVAEGAEGVAEFLVRGDAVYGMAFTGAWSVQKVPLAGGAPVVLDATTKELISEIAADDTHVYYLHRFEVKRAPL